MTHITAQPPTMSTYIPPSEKFVFRRLLARITAHDKEHGTSTPTSTVMFIIEAARELGVDAAQLVGIGDAS